MFGFNPLTTMTYGFNKGGLIVPISADPVPFMRGIAAAKATLGGFKGFVGGIAGSIGRMFRHLRTNFLAISLVGGVAASPVIAFERLNRAMAVSLSVMGDVSDTMKGKMRQAAIEVAKTTNFSATEAAQGYFYLGSSGLSAAESLRAMPVAAKFAQAGLFDLSKATDLLVDTQTALGLRTDNVNQNMINMQHISDALAVGNIKSTATVEQLAEGLQNNLAGALRLANKGMEEGIALLAAFAKSGRKGREAGTAAGIVMRDLQTKAIKYADKFEAAGLKVYDTGGKMRFIADIIEDLEKKLGKLSPKGRKEFLMDLKFTDRSVHFLQSLLGTSEYMREIYKAAMDASGATDKLADSMMTPLQKAINQLKGSFQQFAESMGPVVEVITALVTGMASLLASKGGTAVGQGMGKVFIGIIAMLGDGVQLFIAGVLEMVAAIKELVFRFRTGPMANWLGVGYDSDKDAMAAMKGSTASKNQAYYFNRLPWFSDWLKDMVAKGRADLAAKKPLSARVEDMMAGFEQGRYPLNEAWGDKIGAGLTWAGKRAQRAFNNPATGLSPFIGAMQGAGDAAMAGFNAMPARTHHQPGDLATMIEWWKVVAHFALDKAGHGVGGIGRGVHAQVEAWRKQQEADMPKPYSLAFAQTGTAASFEQRAMIKQQLDADKLQKQILAQETTANDWLSKIFGSIKDGLLDAANLAAP